MLYFSRWKAAAILITAFVVCSFAVPNFFPEQMVQSWPKWAQRHIVLGLDLQGGSHILLEVDSNAVRKEKVEALRDDVRRVLRDARIGYTGLTARNDSVEVRLRDAADVTQALTKLRDLSQPLGGILGGTGARSVDIADAGGGMQIDEAGIAGGLGVAVGHADHGCFLKSQHVVDIVRPVAQERQFRRTGIAEHLSDSERPQQIKRGVLDGN